MKTQINKSNILQLTNGGLDIYLYILKQYYPCKTLFFAGTSLILVRNPFNKNQWSLVLERIDDLVVHRDRDLDSCRGTALDFAQLHFKTGSLEDLLLLLCQKMGLQVPMLKGKDPAPEQEEDWRAQVSFFRPPISNIRPQASLSLNELHQLITGPRYAGITSQLRKIRDPHQKRRFKAAKFPYVTFSGIFEKRDERSLIKPSQLVVFDFDHLPNVEEVKRLLLHETALETEMLFVSPSGDGLKWVLRLEPDLMSHRDFYLSVSNYLKLEFKLETDKSCRDLSRACYIPNDPDSYLGERHWGSGRAEVRSRESEVGSPKLEV